MTYVIEDLDMDSEYVIRVAAVNKFGQGEFIESSPVKTGIPFVPPKISTPPTIANVTEDSCALTWEVPTENGGSPIYGYDVYKRENSGEWTKINDDLVFVPRFTVNGLNAGSTYEFKYEATNEAGLKSNSNVASEKLSMSSMLNKLRRPEVVLDMPGVSIAGTDRVSVEWKPPKQSIPDSSYVVQYRSEGSSYWTDVESQTNKCTISGLKEGVAYVFRVAVKNSAGVGDFSEQTNPLKVLSNVAPTIMKSLRNLSVPKKRELRLEVHASGEPTPEYIWLFEGQEVIPKDDNMEIINEGYMSALIIHHMDNEYVGKYTVEVENSYGKVSSSSNVSIDDVRCHFISSFAELTEVIEGTDIELTCELSDEEAVVNWFKDGRRLSASDRIQFVALARKRTLRIRKSRDDDSGTYRCETSDGSSKTQGDVIVGEEEARIVVGPVDQVVTKFGETVILKCQLDKPARRVKWWKNGVEVWPQMNKAIMKTEEKTATLEIRNFDAHDVGQYTATVSASEESTAAKLSLQVGPSIHVPQFIEQPVIVHAREELDFVVEFTGHPMPNVKVYLNSVSIKALDSDIVTYDDMLSIRIRNLKRDDCGKIKVVAENPYGTIMKEYGLTVLDVPSEPLNLRAYNTLSHQTELAWDAAEETNGSPITGYVIERKGVDNNRWRPVGKVSAHDFTFIADELFSSNVYGFRIRAINAVGESDPSESVDVLTIEDDQESYSETSSEMFIPRMGILETPQKPEVNVMERKVKIMWNKTPETSLYKLERMEESEQIWLELANIEKNSFSDRSIIKTGYYIYRVQSTGYHAMSMPSDPSDKVLVTVPEGEAARMLQAQRTFDSTTTTSASEPEDVVEMKMQQKKKLKTKRVKSKGQEEMEAERRGSGQAETPVPSAPSTPKSSLPPLPPELKKDTSKKVEEKPKTSDSAPKEESKPSESVPTPTPSVPESGSEIGDDKTAKKKKVIKKKTEKAPSSDKIEKPSSEPEVKPAGIIHVYKIIYLAWFKTTI